MSMIATLLQVSPAIFAQIEQNPDLLNDIIFEDTFTDASLDMEEDYLEIDWLHILSPYFEAIAEQAGFDDPEDFESCPEVQANAIYQAVSGTDETGSLEFEFNYGPAYFHTPEEVKALAQKLEAELKTWSEDAEGEDDFGDITLLKDFFVKAASENKYIIGGVN